MIVDERSVGRSGTDPIDFRGMREEMDRYFSCGSFTFIY